MLAASWEKKCVAQLSLCLPITLTLYHGITVV